MATSRFQNNLRFALRKESSEARADIPFNQAEKIGNVLSWFAYEFKTLLVKLICDPRFITICFTALAMLLNSLLFYPTNTWLELLRIYTLIAENINWEYVRFALWAVTEVTILGMGMRAFGRFSNQKLLEHHQASLEV